MSKTVLAWHFLANNRKLRDGRNVPRVGVWLKHDGPVAMCDSGLHASRKITDALHYAPGGIICRVECRDIVEERGDKLVCRERRGLWWLDANDLLRVFARRCALDVVHLWKVPDVVVRYLKTGDDSLRSAANSAANSAADSAAYYAAYYAADSAAYSAALAKQERRLVAMVRAARRAS